MPSHSLPSTGAFTAAAARPPSGRDDSLLDGSGSFRSDEDEPSTPTSEARQHHPPPSIFDLVYEILSLVVAAVALFGVIILLRTYDRKPNPRWSLGSWSDSVTLNAIISILSTVFRASLLLPVTSCISQFGWIWYTHPRGRSLQDLCAYDSASRGSFIGSLLLLFKLRSIHFASVGAWVVLAATALGPFFQQSVTYMTTSIIDPNYSPKAEALASYSWGGDLRGWGELINAHYIIPYDTKAAIRAGLLAPNPLSIPTPPFICPTGNCTWDPFGTLAISSTCHNVSSSVRLDPKTLHFPVTNDKGIEELMTNSSANTLRFRIQSTLPRSVPELLGPYSEMTATTAIVQWFKMTPLHYNIKRSDWNIEAFRCAIYFCLRNVRPSVTNGVYSEEILEEVVRAENAQNVTRDNSNQTTIADPYIETFRFAGLQYRLNKTSSNANNTFVVPYRGFVAMASQFGIDPNLLNGDAIIGSGSDQLMGDSLPAILYNANDTVLAIQNMADSVSTQMRMNGSIVRRDKDPILSPEQSVRGNVWVQQQLVIVRWAWLALPAVLLLLSALFLVAAFLETHRSGVGMWLSSPLTLFFHARFGRDERQTLVDVDFESLNSAESMQKASQRMKAKIARGSVGNIEVSIKEDTRCQEEVELVHLRGPGLADGLEADNTMGTPGRLILDTVSLRPRTSDNRA